MTTWRGAVYLWAAPTSLPGLLLLVCTGARPAWREGVLEAHGRGISRWFDLVAPRRGIIAMTLGHVVLARDQAALEATRAHERVHVAQCERWGPLFVPAYLCASAFAWLRGGDAYFDNAFELEAWRVAPIHAATPAVIDTRPAPWR